MVSSLDDFVEKSWAIFDRFGEDLKQVTLIIVVNKNVQFLDFVEVFFDLVCDVLKSFSNSIVVSRRDSQELHSTILHSNDGSNDVFSTHSDVLYTSSSIEVNILLDLTLAHTCCRFVNGHLDFFIKVRNND